MASSKGRNKRHAHLKKRPVEDGYKERRHTKVCEACGKLCYRSRNEAKRAARLAHPGTVMHIYACPVSGTVWWHISSIPADKLKDLKDRRSG